MTPKLPPGQGNGRRLTQVLINLVGTAIKFTDAGEVVITAEATDRSFHAVEGSSIGTWRRSAGRTSSRASLRDQLTDKRRFPTTV
jgi:signal transduction histidine kinase